MLGTAKRCPIPKNNVFVAHEKPLATFVLKYRTRGKPARISRLALPVLTTPATANLQALHIIPRENSPAPSTEAQVATDPSKAAPEPPREIKREVEEAKADPGTDRDAKVTSTSSMPALSPRTPATRLSADAPLR